jgi:hypothetical protein
VGDPGNRDREAGERGASAASIDTGRGAALANARSRACDNTAGDDNLRPGIITIDRESSVFIRT